MRRPHELVRAFGAPGTKEPRASGGTLARSNSEQSSRVGERSFTAGDRVFYVVVFLLLLVAMFMDGAR